MEQTATQTGGGVSWRKRIWRIVRIPLFAYLGIIVVLWWLENKLVYHPAGVSDWEPPPIEAIQDVYFTTSDGAKLHGWWLHCPDAPSALLYCHGNAGNLSHRGRSIVKIRDLLQVSVLIFDYPGYGKSEGRPNEQACYQAADAAYHWLVEEKKADPKQILFYGGSLGGGVAVDLAARKPHRGMVLAKTFTTMPDTAASLYPWLPVRWVMSNRFDNLTKIKQIKQPVFIGHGTADTLIPFAQGKALFEAANQPKEFFVLQGADHNDGLPEEFFRAFKAFLAKHERP